MTTEQLLPAAQTVQRPITAEEMGRAHNLVGTVSSSFSATVVGQERLRRALLVSLLAGGHVLLESVPGLAKTLAATSLARAVQGEFSRIQCTPDLLPSDITGTQIYNAQNSAFETQLGPVHANFVLLDEINRSSAKTQSAMLEAMQEHQTSIGGIVYPLPSPFIVMATQNPIEQEGTYQLPEAQMDRFLLKEILDYPTVAEELEVLNRLDSGAFDNTASLPTVNLDDVEFLQGLSRRVYVDASIRSYIVSLIYVTRHPRDYIGQELANYVAYGASPRGSIAFIQAARALALLNGRSHVIPDDVKELRHAVLRHRVMLNFEAEADDVRTETIIDAIFGSVATP